MFKKLPFSFKILIGLNVITSIFSILILGFYIFNNVVSDNGMPVGPLKVFYTISFLLGVGMILLLLYTKKVAVIASSLYAIMMITSGLRGNILQIIIGIIIFILIFSKSTMKYVGYIKSKKKKKK
jgi:hypothetical protein